MFGPSLRLILMCRTQNIFTPANVNSIVLVHYNPTCDFSIEALCLSIIGLISIPSMSRSLSPWEKLSSSSWAELQSTIEQVHYVS